MTVSAYAVSKILCLNQLKVGVMIHLISGAAAGGPMCPSIWAGVYTHYFTARNSTFTQWELLLHSYNALHLKATAVCYDFTRFNRQLV